MELPDRIVIEPGRRSGKPCIRGTRITVYDIVGWFASGMSEAEVLEDFDELTREDLLAAFAFAARAADRTVRMSA